MKIAVIGTGAMGSIYAARFSRAGHEVVAIDIWQDHVNYINRNGLFIDGPDGQIIAKNIKASTKFSDLKGCHFYIIATKAMKLEESIKSLKDWINLNSPIITIQNGLGAGDIILRHMPENNIILGVAEGFGASLQRPGHVTHTANKQIRLGSISKISSEKELRNIVDQSKKEIKEGVVVGFSTFEDKVGVAVGVSKDLTSKYDAVNLVKIASETLGGKGGGGRKDFAQAGGVDKNKVEKAFKEISKTIN